jgi:putative endonuclease
MEQWSLYVVRTRDGHLYTGIATDVGRRLEEHREGSGRGARYLRGRGPLELVFQGEVGDRALAQRVEHRLKRRPKQEKEAIVHDRPTGEELIERLLPEEREGAAE